VRDTNLNTMRAELTAWLSARALPEWMVERTQHLHAWKSPGRFIGLAKVWSRPENRFAGDEPGHDLITAWLRREYHLESYESNSRATALRRRRERYRVLAAQLAKRYRTLVVSDAGLDDFQRSPRDEEEHGDIPAVKRQQRLAAGSELRGVLANAFSKERVREVDAMDITRACHRCGVLNERTAELHVTCAGCGAIWDQDANACHNMIRRAQQEAAPAPERKPTRSQMLRSKKGPGAAIAAPDLEVSQ